MIAALLADLHKRGVAFRLSGDRVHWRAPAGTIRPAELVQLRAHREEVFDLIDRIEERRAIREHDGGQTHVEAEAAAWHELAILASEAWQGAA